MDEKNNTKESFAEDIEAMEEVDHTKEAAALYGLELHQYDIAGVGNFIIEAYVQAVPGGWNYIYTLMNPTKEKDENGDPVYDRVPAGTVFVPYSDSFEPKPQVEGEKDKKPEDKKTGTKNPTTEPKTTE